jgi:hypothetical protein
MSPSQHDQKSPTAHAVTSYEDLDRQPVPFKKGDWVESKHGNLQVGIVQDCYWSSGAGYGPDVVQVDICLYDYKGKKVGRASPAQGGPRTYEPCLLASDWKRIEKPIFPIVICSIPSEDGTRVTLDYATMSEALPDREHIRVAPKRALKLSPVKTTSPNGFNLEAEILGKRLAAEKLRDTAHKLFRDNPEVKATMIAEAEKLEREADILAKNN